MKNMKCSECTKINDFGSEQSKFLFLLKLTKKWKELFNQTESLIAVIFSIAITGSLLYLYKSVNSDELNDLIKRLLEIASSSLLGLLGFIISGIAIFTGTITNKLVKNIDNDNKAINIIGILFSFYFIGFIIGITSLLCMITYIFIYSNLVYQFGLILAISFMLSYLYVFCVFYSISLIGTCLRLFLISYRFSNDLSVNEKDMPSYKNKDDFK